MTNNERKIIRSIGDFFLLIYRRGLSDVSAVVCPVKEGLSLTRSAVPHAGGTVLFDLSDVSSKGLPAFYLSFIVFTSSSSIISTVPLKPSSGIIFPDPSFFFPIRERFGCRDGKEVHSTLCGIFGKLNTFKPAFGKFLAAVSHVSSAKNSHFKEFWRSEFWFEIGMVIFPGRFAKGILIPSLHFVVDGDGDLLFSHRKTDPFLEYSKW